jgi:hypothetical protein
MFTFTKVAKVLRMRGTFGSGFFLPVSNLPGDGKILTPGTKINLFGEL